jgi:ParB-like partition proteins
MNEVRDEITQLYLDDIIPNRFQPREIFDEKALKELAASIKEHGVIQPIIVRNIGGKYEIIAGERRYKASALAGLTKIPAIIRNLDDKESSKVALLENLQRKDLNAIEEARTYQKILELDEMTQEELAKTMGKSQSAVANKIRLLSLPDEIQTALLKEQISERHARSLLNISNPAEQIEMLKKIITNKLSVRQLEAELKAKEEPKEISSSAQINTNPLTPDASLLTSSNPFGEIKIAPPTENEEMEPIDFSSEEDDEEENEEKFNDISIPSIDEVKANTEDVGTQNNFNLDSLLNINTLNQHKTTAEKIIENDDEKHNVVEENYFQSPDFTVIPTPKEEPVYTLETGKEKLLEVINELKSKGLRIDVQQMDLTNTFQIIIKLEK